MKLERLGNRVLVWMSIIALAFLSVMSILFTQKYGLEELGEIENGAAIYQIHDNILWHLAGIAGIVVLFRLLALLQNRIGERGLLAVQITLALLAGLFALSILLGGTRTPKEDQAHLYYAAELFNRGDYGYMVKGGYFDMYPQQFGMVLYIQLVYKIFGNGCFQAVQALNCLWIAGTVFVMGRCMNRLTGQMNSRLAGSLLMAFCLPLLLLCSFVYGDVPCFFFIFLFLLSYQRFIKGNRRYLAWMTISMCLCLIFRKHSLIFIAAFVLALLFHWWNQRKKIFLMAALLIVLLPIGSVKLIEHYYESVSGYAIDGGLPSIMWVAMGMIEDGSKPGWFNNYSVPVYYEMGYDREQAAEAAWQKIRERADYFAENPVYGISFLKRKICTQWNEPYFNTNYRIDIDGGGEGAGITGFLQRQQYGAVMQGLSVYQAVIYLGALLYCITVAFGKKVSENVILIIFVGGMLFSVIWEANSRYIFPYVLLMIPLAAVGWGTALKKLKVWR